MKVASPPGGAMNSSQMFPAVIEETQERSRGREQDAPKQSHVASGLEDSA